MPEVGACEALAWEVSSLPGTRAASVGTLRALSPPLAPCTSLLATTNTVLRRE
jgi:hypothetical protein